MRSEAARGINRLCKWKSLQTALAAVQGVRLLALKMDGCGPIGGSFFSASLASYQRSEASRLCVLCWGEEQEGG